MGLAAFCKTTWSIEIGAWSISWRD